MAFSGLRVVLLLCMSHLGLWNWFCLKISIYWTPHLAPSSLRQICNAEVLTGRKDALTALLSACSFNESFAHWNVTGYISYFISYGGIRTWCQMLRSSFSALKHCQYFHSFYIGKNRVLEIEIHMIIPSPHSGLTTEVLKPLIKNPLELCNPEKDRKLLGGCEWN